MQKTSKSRLFIFIPLLVLCTFAFAATANATYVITSIDFQIVPSATTAKIGDDIYFNMSVIDVTSTYTGVSFVSATTGQIVLTSTNFPISPGWLSRSGISPISKNPRLL